MATQRKVTPSAPRRRGTAGQDRSQEVLIALRRIIRATDLHSKYLTKKLGLTIPQIVILQSVRDLGEVTTGRLSDHVTLSQATTTTILDRLESRGFVERYRSHKDRRIVHTRLTNRGRAILRNAPPLLHERFLRAFSALKKSDQNRIVSTLEEVADMLGARSLDAAPLLVVASPDRGPVATPAARD